MLYNFYINDVITNFIVHVVQLIHINFMYKRSNDTHSMTIQSWRMAYYDCSKTTSDVYAGHNIHSIMTVYK